MLHLVVSLTLLASPTAGPISLEMPAASAKAVVARLSSLTGETLSVTDEVGREILLVSCRNVPAADVLDRVAKITASEWVAVDGGRRLTRNADLLQEESREALELRAQAIERAVAALYPPTDSDGPLTAEQAKAAAIAAKTALEEVAQELGKPGFSTASVNWAAMLGNRTGTGRLLRKAIHLLGAKELASIPAGRRVVYALHPTRMQRALPAGIADAAKAFVSDHAMWLKAIESIEPPGLHVSGGPDLITRIPVTAVGEVLIVASRISKEDSIKLSLLVGDQNGNSVADAQVTIDPRYEPLELGAPRPLSLSSEASAFLQAAAAARKNSLPMPAETWYEKWSRPDENEPLAYVAGDILSAAAKGHSLNLIASMPDRAYAATIADARAASITSATIATRLSSWGMKARLANGWMTVSPLDPGQARALRIDRTALSRLMRSSLAAREATLATLSAYCARRPTGLVGPGMDYEWVALLGRRIDNAGEAMRGVGEDSQMLRVFAALSPAQLDSLSRGGTVPISNLSTAASQGLDLLVFHSEPGPELDKIPADALYKVIASLAEERTRYLGGGVPRNGFVSLERSQPEAFKAISTTNGTAGVFPELEFVSVMADNKITGRQGFDRIRIGTEDRFRFVFRLTPESRVERTLSHFNFDRNAQALTYDQLPERIRTKIDAAIKRALGSGG